jgi:riboflavin kinase/FMN adenylyltransferase
VNVVLTVGTFDGVHIGHQKIIERIKAIAERLNGETALLTFYPHPRKVLFEDSDLKLIHTQEEKEQRLEKAGIDHLIVHPFTKDFSRLTALQYVRDLLVQKIGVRALVVGYDHHFGRNREGSFDELREYGEIYDFEVVEIPAQDIDDVSVSSTKIRNALAEGDVQRANQFLGSPFLITGTVVVGQKLGRELGFPTANIRVEEDYKLLPANGVYAAYIYVAGVKYSGMLNIGVRPTVDGKSRTIEANVFDFDGDVYGHRIQLELIGRIRDEMRFDDLNALKSRLNADRIAAQGMLE